MDDERWRVCYVCQRIGNARTQNIRSFALPLSNFDWGEGGGGYRWFVTFPGSHFGMYASRSRGKARGIYVLAPLVVQFSHSGVRGLGFLFALYLGRRRLWYARQGKHAGHSLLSAAALTVSIPLGRKSEWSGLFILRKHQSIFSEQGVGSEVFGGFYPQRRHDWYAC